LRNPMFWAALILTIGVIAGCGDEGAGPAGSGAPAVTLTDPANGATGVMPNKPVLITFSASMDEATLDSIFVDGVAFSAREYDGDTHTVTLWFGKALDGGAVHQVRVSADVADEAGNTMGEDYTFSFTTGPFSCGGLYDPFESNDDIAGAVAVAVNTWYRLVPSCGSESRLDYYEFALTDTAKATVVLDVVDADTTHMRWGIGFYRVDGETYSTLGTGYFLIPFEETYHYSFLPGTYYARIYKYDDDQYTGIYNFMIETSEPCADDQYEDNDFEDEATPINAGLYEGLRGCHVDADIYSLYVEEGKTLRVTMTEVSTRGGSRLLSVWGPGGSAGDTNQVEPRVETVLTSQAGTYYIMTQWWTDDVTYDLNVEILD
jgi:hypothetical protein